MLLTGEFRKTFQMNRLKEDCYLSGRDEVKVKMKNDDAYNPKSVGRVNSIPDCSAQIDRSSLQLHVLHSALAGNGKKA